jgi:hypothetical protein
MKCKCTIAGLVTLMYAGQITCTGVLCNRDSLRAIRHDNKSFKQNYLLSTLIEIKALRWDQSGRRHRCDIHPSVARHVYRNDSDTMNAVDGSEHYERPSEGKTFW